MQAERAVATHAVDAAWLVKVAVARIIVNYAGHMTVAARSRITEPLEAHVRNYFAEHILRGVT